MSRECIHFFFEGLQSRAEVVAGLSEGFGVEAHAVLFYASENGQEGHFDFRKHVGHVALGHLFAQDRVEAQGDIGIFAGVVADFARSEVAHVFLLATGADEFLNVDGAVVEIGLGEVIHVVALLGFHDIVRQHGVEELAFHLDAVVGEDGEVVFQVLSDLDLPFVLKEGAEGIDKFLSFCLIFRNGDVPRASALNSEAHPHHFGAHCVNSGRFGVKCNNGECQ